MRRQRFYLFVVNRQGAWLCIKRKEHAMRRKVIIDCDPGIDDSLAIMLALSLPEIEVVGITIVCGNSPTQMGAQNAGKVLRQMGRLDIPVYCGEERPLKRDYVDALDTHGADGLGESWLAPAEGFEVRPDAVTFLERTILAARADAGDASTGGGGCSVIALGPMTNLARLIERNPAAFAAIDELVSMGGAFKSHGNCSPVAEYNYWADPDAAALVYETAAQQGRLIHMVGLDVTRRIVLTPDLLAYMKRLDEATGTFVEQITRFYMDFHWQWEHLIGCVINDPLAVAYFADRSLCRGLDAYTAVETGGISIGQTVVDAMDFYRRPANARVLTETDPLRFHTMFMAALLHRDSEELDLLADMVRSPQQVRQHGNTAREEQNA